MDKTLKRIKLSNQINREIGFRIIISFLLLIIIVIAFTFSEVAANFKQLKIDLKRQSEELTSFIISQELIKNSHAIQLKLDVISQLMKNKKFVWEPNKKNLTDGNLHWEFPLSWHYSYLVKNIDDSTLGSLYISGPIFGDNTVSHNLLTKIALLLLFFIIIFVVLNPLSRRIPQRLFITPISHIFLLLSNKKYEIQPEDLADVSEEISEIYSKIVYLLEDVEARSKEAALGQIATQVAHDIRSPLMVLKRVLNDLSGLSERKRVDARNAIQRVTDIANNLLSQYRYGQGYIQTNNFYTSEPVAMMLESIVSEKRIQICNSNIDISCDFAPGSQNLFVNVDIVGFKRVLSNLINNAIEAQKDQPGKIIVSLAKQNCKIVLSVNDNGCGIPDDKLFAIKQGESFGKNKGFGLGLSYAFKKIEEWQGEYKITSIENEGTQFQILLPQAKPSEWFKNEVWIHSPGKIIILDDDDIIHQIWDERFNSQFLKEHNLELIHFKNPHEFLQFCLLNSISDATFLLDYELRNYEITGLDLMEQLSIAHCSTLVTNCYEEEDVRQRCKNLGVKILPKAFAELTPVKVFSPSNLVFIDDEEIIANYWKESAELSGRKINVFTDPQEFINLQGFYAKDTLIYMDSSLGEVSGEEIAKKLYDDGYQNIILATGYPKQHFEHVTWVKDIIGKEPPWQ